MLRKNENIVARKIHDTFFLIDIKQRYVADKCLLYEINELGFFIWNILSETGDIQKIASIIKEEIEDDIELSLIEKDVIDFLDALSREGYIVDGRD